MISIKFRYVLGIDPSGNYYEGKGTTGWCLFDCANNKIADIGTISSKDYNTQYHYWKAHLILIYNYVNSFLKDKVAVSMEDYRLYASKANNQINSKFETVQLIGIIKYWCISNNVTLKMRLATAAKTRFTDEYLVKKHYIQKQKKSYFCNAKLEALATHERDALRHALYFYYFENGGREYW